MNVADFLIERLENVGIKHVFGIPGDYVLDLYAQLSQNPKIQVVNTCDEAGAGFAADAYARVNGIGCVCVTYNVGALKIANSVACAYAERSPLIIISGSPGVKERKEGMLLHHMVRSFSCQKEVFEKWTCASTVLDNPYTAGYEIDRVLEALKHHKQPVYIEVPRDIAKKTVKYDITLGTPDSPKSDEENLLDAIAEVEAWIIKAKNPVILAGVQIARYHLGAEITSFAEKLNIPIATTLLSKSVINENHPLFAGVYMGDSSREEVRKLVDESDCLLMFGVLRTDMTLCFKPSVFPKRQVVDCSVEGLKVKSHTYTNIQFADFCKKLFDLNFTKRVSPSIPAKPEISKFVPQKNTPITTVRFFDKINSILNKNMAIVADVGDSLFGASDLIVHHRNFFLSPAFYTTMGFAIPGALGLQKAMPDVRPIVLVGDGAFQMSCVEISTMSRHNLNPIIFVLNNKGYTTERFLKDGPFNDLEEWRYDKIFELMGSGYGWKVETEEELEAAIGIAIDKKKPSVINVVVGKKDISSALKRMTEALAKRV